MRDCIRCGEAFENKTRYNKVCDNCKHKNYENMKKRRYSGKPYWKRTDDVTIK